MGLKILKFVFMAAAVLCTAVGGLLSILCIINQTQHNTAFQNIYFVQLNTTSLFSVNNATELAQSIGDQIQGDLANQLTQIIEKDNSQIQAAITQLEKQMKEISGVPDWYSVGLWNYCEGKADDYTNPTYCSKPSSKYYFNPVKMIENDLSDAANTQISLHLSDEAEYGLKISKGICYALRAMYILGFMFFVFTLASVLVSGCPFFGPLLVSVCCFFATVFTLVAACMAVAFYRVVISKLEEHLTMLNIPMVLGKKIFAYSFISAAAGIAALILFFIANLTTYSPV
ncbi:plasma membrane anchored protein, claudin family, SUR7 subfamily, predicted membrane sensor Pun1 [Schizosaccharomyces osmophilus]|uniref:Plasma membrane anchored protein, claudin family, SUR7 subfamily, predicted membrane sensor Pun1 n=1 Tax=Schizosaccharomyces osmophilus TaxID=2545709 RepID=A0AAF0AVC6_9SCHI|nr:plasma membrane anchored protein, claudin family, SUR7 subfamily, predicted membrane sensor Pun1 [Schizosaccharomyces osmophilus]WBW73426.1 plasma membrane anchored protein, claudin family, SUR7 subfamily, predicted membrane sensor Pun1 [Schizosaccharomyces osmophilus]